MEENINIDNNEEILKKHLEKISSPKTEKINETKQNKIENSLGETFSDSEYIAFDINILPASIFYPDGSLLLVKPASTKDILNYSTLEDNNMLDAHNKMKNLISSCVKIKYPNGVKVSADYIYHTDIYTILFLINEVTKTKANARVETVNCDGCDKKTNIYFKTSNFINYKIPKSIKKLYSDEDRCIKLNLDDYNQELYITPITFKNGRIQDQYFRKRFENNNNILSPEDISFAKCLPLLSNGADLTNDLIKEIRDEFDKLSTDDILYLFEFSEKFLIGIDKVKGVCECGSEVYTKFKFPGNTYKIFSNRKLFVDDED